MGELRELFGIQYLMHRLSDAQSSRYYSSIANDDTWKSNMWRNSQIILLYYLSLPIKISIYSNVSIPFCRQSDEKIDYSHVYTVNGGGRRMLCLMAQSH